MTMDFPRCSVVKIVVALRKHKFDPWLWKDHRPCCVAKRKKRRNKKKLNEHLMPFFASKLK